MDYRGFTAKTVDEAITQACLDLGVTSDRLDYKVMQEPTNGFLGIGSKPAIISARIRPEEIAVEEKPVEVAAPIEIAVEDKPAVPESNSVKSPDSTAGKEIPAGEEPVTAKEEKKIITSDEIEKRALAAAQKSKVEGRTREFTQDRRPRRGEEGKDRKKHGVDRPAHRRKPDLMAEKKEELPVYHEPSKPKPQRIVKERSEEEAAELMHTAEEFLKGVFSSMQIEAEMTLGYDGKEGAVNCVISGEEMGLLIGKRGQTLDSLQYLTSIVVNKKTDDYVRVKLDTEDYRSRRADTLNNLAKNIAFKVKRSRRPVALEPMNPYERRIIHSALQNNRFVETYSEGEEPYRHVVVAPKR